MARMQKGGQGVFRGPNGEQGSFPWLLALFVLGMLIAVGYTLDNDRSLSESKGVVTDTEAEDGVIPSLPPQ